MSEELKRFHQVRRHLESLYECKDQTERRRDVLEERLDKFRYPPGKRGLLAIFGRVKPRFR